MYISMYLLVNLYPYLYTHVDTYIHTDRQTYIHTYIYSQGHTQRRTRLAGVLVLSGLTQIEIPVGVVCLGGSDSWQVACGQKGTSPPSGPDKDNLTAVGIARSCCNALAPPQAMLCRMC